MTGIQIERLKESFAQQYSLRVDHIAIQKPNRLYTIRTQGEKYALKIFTQEAQLKWQGDCLEQLEQRKTAGVIPFFRNIQDSFVNWIEESSSKFGVLPFVQGSSLDPEVFPDLKNCMALLGHIHASGQQIQGRQPMLTSYSIWLEKLVKRYLSFSESIQALEYTESQKKHEDGLIPLLLSFKDEALAWAQWVLNYLPKSELLFLEHKAQINRQIVHLDVAAHNFMVRDNSYYLLDFDLMQYSPVVLDVAQYVHRSLLHYNWSFDVVLELLSEYQKEHKLDKNECALLPFLFVYPHDIFREWLGVWRQQSGFQVQGIMKLFQKLETSWNERRKFVRACQAMVK